MNVLLRFLRAINYTIMLYVVAAAAIVLTITSPTISEVVINFCFGGIVPGTNHVLAPGIVITGVIVGLALIVVGILSSWLLRVVAVKQAMKHVGLNLPALLEAPAPSPTIATADVSASGVLVKKASSSKTAKRRSSKKTAVIVKPRSLPMWFSRFLHKPSTQAVDYAWSDRLQTILLPVKRVVATTAVYVFVTLRSVSIGIIRLLTSIVFALIAITAITGDWLFEHALAIARALRHKSVVAGRTVVAFTRANAVRFWHWLQPRAVKFDIWLEVQYRRVAAWGKKRFGRSEPAQVMTMIFREIRNSVRQLFK